MQTAINNIENGSIIASDGTWIYYDDHGLCRIRLKDNLQETIFSSDLPIEEMFYAGNTLYYHEFSDYCKLNLNYSW